MGLRSSSSAIFLLKSSRKVRTVWWVSFGSEVEFDLKMDFPVDITPKWSHKLIRLLKFFKSLDNSVLLIDLGVGKKFKLYPRSLNSVSGKDFFDKFITCPKGSELNRFESLIVLQRRL